MVHRVNPTGRQVCNVKYIRDGVVGFAAAFGRLRNSVSVDVFVHVGGIVTGSYRAIAEATAGILHRVGAKTGRAGICHQVYTKLLHRSVGSCR